MAVRLADFSTVPALADRRIAHHALRILTEFKFLGGIEKWMAEHC